MMPAIWQHLRYFAWLIQCGAVIMQSFSSQMFTKHSHSSSVRARYGHSSMTPNSVMPTAASCIYISWKNTTLNLPKTPHQQLTWSGVMSSSSVIRKLHLSCIGVCVYVITGHTGSYYKRSPLYVYISKYYLIPWGVKQRSTVHVVINAKQTANNFPSTSRFPMISAETTAKGFLESMPWMWHHQTNCKGMQ